MYDIRPAKESEITKIVCPDCRERLPRIGLLKDSNIKGLTFKCGRCGKLWEVTASPNLPVDRTEMSQCPKRQSH